jgi:hypothetical protein
VFDSLSRHMFLSKFTLFNFCCQWLLDGDRLQTMEEGSVFQIGSPSTKATACFVLPASLLPFGQQNADCCCCRARDWSHRSKRTQDRDHNSTVRAIPHKESVAQAHRLFGSVDVPNIEYSYEIIILDRID